MGWASTGRARVQGGRGVLGTLMLALAAFLAFPAAAPASTGVSGSPPTVFITDPGPDPMELVSVQPSFISQDQSGTVGVRAVLVNTFGSASPIALGGSCFYNPGYTTSATCAAGSSGKFDRIDATLGGGDDFLFTQTVPLRANGGAGNDSLSSSTMSGLSFPPPSQDDLSGETGFDSLSAFDGDADRVDCGGNGISRLLKNGVRLKDQATVDLKDEVLGCAAVNRTPIGVGPTVEVRTGSAEVGDGRVKVTLACPLANEKFGTNNARTSPCSGRLELRRRKKRLDSTGFKVPIGKRRPFTLKVGDAKGFVRAITTEDSPRGEKTTISPLKLKR